MQAVLFTTNPEDCNVCAEAVKNFKKVFADELKTEEAAIVYIDKDEGAQEFWATHQLPLAPVVVITTDDGKVLDRWETGEIPEFEETKAPEPAAAVAA